MLHQPVNLHARDQSGHASQFSIRNYSAGFICILIKKVLDMVFGDIFKNRLDSQSH